MNTSTILVGCCIALLLLCGGCDSDDPVSNDNNNAPVAELAGGRVGLPCTGAGSAAVNCATADNAISSATLLGEDQTSYDVTLRIRGVVEQKTYTDVVSSDGMWAEGGTPDASSFNVFKVEISSPPQTYHLNAGASFIDHCFSVDFTKTVVVDHGATVALSADAGGDGLGTRNIDGNDQPIVVPGIPPAPAAFDGQFLQLDVLGIKVLQ